MTYGDIQVAVAEYLKAIGYDLPPSERALMVKLAIHEIQRAERLRFCIHEATLELTANTYTVALPVDFIDVRRIRLIVDATSWVEVECQIEADFDLESPLPSVATPGTPSRCTIKGQTLMFCTPASSTLPLVLNYWRFLPELAAPDDTNALLTQAWDLVLYQALEEGALFLPTDSRFQAFQQKKQLALNSLIVDEARLGSDARRRPQSRFHGQGGR